MSSESSSRRTSLRRLSSIASLQALNPFTRRRSNQTDASIATSSTLSLASTSQNKFSTSSSQIFPSYDIDEMDEGSASIPPLSSYSRKSSYICLPDDPIGGMPRSRTFSSLPPPSKARKSAMTTSKSHSRLPSAVHSSHAPPLPPITRIPTPPVSTRKHSISHITPVPRVKRSDTEPLLQYDVGRSTAFKENISPSPRKYDHMETAHSDFRGAPTYHAPAHKSSPTYRGSMGRPTTPMSASTRPDGMQRWHSQPMIRNIDVRQPSEMTTNPQWSGASNGRRLSEVTNHIPPPPVNTSRQRANTIDHRHSRHGEIQERRLIGEVQPEIAPPPKTPRGNQALLNSSSRRRAHSSSVREVPESSPSRTPPQPRQASPVRQSTNQVHVAEPIGYWCGRFSTLNDRYRNEELLMAVGSPKQDSDKIHSQDANNRRMRRALEHLHGLCATSEARESFVLFQLQLAALQKNPYLGRPVGSGSGPDKLIILSRLEEGDESERGSTTIDSSPSEARKKSLMHRLLGRGKGDRRSLVT